MLAALARSAGGGWLGQRVEHAAVLLGYVIAIHVKVWVMVLCPNHFDT
jgi:hypothetical protein